MDSSDKVKAQTEPLSSISISIAHYFKSLQASNYILIHNTLRRDLSILFFFFRC